MVAQWLAANLFLAWVTFTSSPLFLHRSVLQRPHIPRRGLTWWSGGSATTLRCDLRQVKFPLWTSDSCPVNSAWVSPGQFVKMQNLESHPRGCHSVGLGWGFGICICNCHVRWFWCESLSTLGPWRDLFKPVRTTERPLNIWKRWGNQPYTSSDVRYTHPVSAYLSEKMAIPHLHLLLTWDLLFSFYSSLVGNCLRTALLGSGEESLSLSTIHCLLQGV